MIRAINASTTEDSTVREFTVPPDECEETVDVPDDDPEDPDDQPEGEAPGPFVDLSVGLRCHPYGQAHASWTAIKGATSYTLLQSNNTIVEVTGPTGGRINATAELLPGQAFEFALQAHNTAGTLTGPITVPEFPPCPADQALVAAGDGTVLMVDQNLNLWGWGRNSQVLGEGTSDVGEPKLLQALTFVPAKLLVHQSVAVILDQQGRVHVWGSASNGRLAVPGVTSLPNPTLVSGLEDIVDVAMGRSHILALDIAGRVWIWGSFLGRRIEQPERVPLAEGIVRIAAGTDTAFALRPNGTVLSWGSNEAYDVLGHGRAEVFPEPQLVPGIEGAESIYAAGYGMFFVRHDGSAASLGEAFFPDDAPGVTERPELGELHSLSLGVDFGVAVTEGGVVLAWGENGYGQLGRPVDTSGVLEPPQHVAGLPQVQAVFADTFYTVAVDQSGRLHAWGANGRNQLGLNAIPELRTFTPVALPEDTGAVETGPDFVLALGVSGTVYSWGSNEYGQLGRTTDRSFDWQPGEVENLHEIVQVAAGENFALALDSSGQVHTWGYAADGALGDGPPTSEYRQSPAPIPGFFGVEKVAAGSHHAVALQAGGRMYTWGAGTYGALGQGNQTDRFQPHSVFIPDTVVNDTAWWG